MKEKTIPEKHHHLKCDAKYFKLIESGVKKFELRKNDRDFKENDMVYLEEVVNGVLTGQKLPPINIKYILTDDEGSKYGLSKGYCIFCW